MAAASANDGGRGAPSAEPIGVKDTIDTAIQSRARVPHLIMAWAWVESSVAFEEPVFWVVSALGRPCRAMAPSVELQVAVQPVAADR
jgi:hypothetical protein